MGNKKVEMTSSLSPQQQQIESLLGNKISAGINQGVSPYTGPIAANPDMLSLMAAQMMASYMNPGSSYQLPTFQMGQNYGAQQAAPQTGGVASPTGMPAGPEQRRRLNPFEAR